MCVLCAYPPPPAVDADTTQAGGDKGNSPDSDLLLLYSNSPEADTYLTLQSPDYMGGHAVLYHDRCDRRGVQTQGRVAGRGWVVGMRLDEAGGGI